MEKLKLICIVANIKILATYLFYFLFTSIPSVAQGNCSYLGAPIYRQSQLDSLKILYANCDSLSGRITLFFGNITNIESLSHFKRIESLAIFDANIYSLKGLENISIHKIEIGNCPKLKSLTNFPKIENKGHISIKQLKITTLPKIVIDTCNYVALSGLDSLVNVDSIKIGYATLLISNCHKINLTRLIKSFGKLNMLLINQHFGEIDPFPMMEIQLIEFYKCNKISSLSILDSIYGIQSFSAFSNEKLAVCSTDLICRLISEGKEFEFDNNEDGCNSKNEVKSMCSSSINDKIVEDISIFPNPAFDFLIVKSNQEFDRISIYNMQGNFVSQFQMDSYQQNIDITNLLSGTYIAKLSNNKGFTKIKRFSKL